MKLGHIGIPIKDLQASKNFYDSIVNHIGLTFIDQSSTSVRYGEEGSARLYLHTRQSPTSNIHLCFETDVRRHVDAFHQAATTAGGTDFGPPGVRENYSPTYYAAFVLDPDGNNIELVCRN